MGSLHDMQNIGKAIEGLLLAAGIKTSEELINLGSREAFLRIRNIDATACIRMLYALEGAVSDTMDTKLSVEKKKELKDFFRSLPAKI